jgi:hypothetical protein
MAEPTAVKTKRKVEMNSAQYARSDAGETLRLRWATRLLEEDAMAEKLSPRTYCSDQCSARSDAPARGIRRASRTL